MIKMVTFTVLVTATLLYITQASHTLAQRTISNYFINEINLKQNLWKAGQNFPKDTSISNLKKLGKTTKCRIEEKMLFLNASRQYYRGSPPVNFDARNSWPYCPTLMEVRDQGACGSCWAVAVVAAMSDRVCIQTRGKDNFHFSAEDMLACCPQCSYGCRAGKQIHAWKHSAEHGVVSGGNYNSREGCKPYTYPPCDHPSFFTGRKKLCPSYNKKTECKQSCHYGYNKNYEEDLRIFKDILVLDRDNHTSQLLEILNHGPVTAVMEVYEDFFTYKSGIYEHVSGERVFYHTVKILGWGVDNNVKYWLAANSWGSDWGDGGFFKILRGKNHCRIEEEMAAGLYHENKVKSINTNNISEFRHFLVWQYR